jgi:transcriptional regulator with XRE-family HTH domain
MTNIKNLWEDRKKTKKITQKKAAAELGWSQSTLSQFINGKLKPNVIAVIKLSDYFGVDPIEVDKSVRLRRVK